MADKTEEVDLRTLIDRGYDELRKELDATEEMPAIVPSEPDDEFGRDVRTVLIDAEAAAMEYAVASSLNPDLKVSVPAEGETAPRRASSIRVVKGRMSEPPPIGRKSEPIKIVKGTKISK